MTRMYRASVKRMKPIQLPISRISIMTITREIYMSIRRLLNTDVSWYDFRVVDEQLLLLPD